MKRATLIGACIAAMLLVSGRPLQAQSSAPAPAAEGKDTAGTALAKKAADAFTQPLHPVVTGVPSGGGIAAGVGYDFPKRGRWQTSAEAVISIHGYWSTVLTTTRETPRTSLTAYGRIRDMGSLVSFGPGTNSIAGDRTVFSMRDPVLGVVGSVRVSPWVTVGARLDELWPQIGVASTSRYPGTQARFGEVDAPGIAAQPRFGRYHAFVDLTSDAGPVGTLYQGGKTRFGYGLFDDQEFDRYSFRRLDVETRHRFTMFGPHRLLTLHGWVSTTDASDGNDVPFFLQHTLGGKGNLRSVNESLIGTDGTDATLRGFRTFRFRDRHLLLLQAEYRLPLWGPLDATVFVDAGKVAPRRSDLDLSDLKRSYGFSLSAMRGTHTVVRMDVGFGGGEGTHLFFTIGRGM
jgi:hypothetical protein